MCIENDIGMAMGTERDIYDFEDIDDFDEVELTPAAYEIVVYLYDENDEIVGVCSQSQLGTFDREDDACECAEDFYESLPNSPEKLTELQQVAEEAKYLRVDVDIASKEVDIKFEDPAKCFSKSIVF